jgi:hypothetical protein
MQTNDIAAATLAELLREAARRRKERWLAGEWTIPVRIVDDGEQKPEDALSPPCDGVPECLEIHIIHPAPTVEAAPYAPDHAAAVDVTPAPYRPPPMPSPPPSSARSLPPPKGQIDPRSINIPPRLADAERRRTQRFLDDDWGSSSDWPIRYPRGYGH